MLFAVVCFLLMVHDINRLLGKRREAMETENASDVVTQSVIVRMLRRRSHGSDGCTPHGGALWITVAICA